LRRIGQPVEIAGVAVFLASQAASFVTGQHRCRRRRHTRRLIRRALMQQ
jgi:NAD(P)-dependent dehydrogenase (short-subunit alcohol dehydrogenase family)